ncbi:MAG: PadR family transcriptional regulator [Candidatus Hodarchaeales archaeon]
MQVYKNPIRADTLANEDENNPKTLSNDLSSNVRNWERDLRRGLLQLMVLLLIRLRTQEAHGYGLIKILQKTNISLKAGTVYPLLKRMEKEGLISSILAEDIESPGMPRRLYTITELGEKMIESMMRKYSSYDESIKHWYTEISQTRR